MMNEALKIAWDLRDEFGSRGEYLLSDYRKALRERLKDFPNVDVNALVRKVDRESCAGKVNPFRAK